MSDIAMICAVADMDSVNATLESQGFGPNNFRIPVWGGDARPTHATNFAWANSAFLSALQAIPEVILDTTGTGIPRDRVKALVEAQGRVWPSEAPRLPSSGIIRAGEYYRYLRGTLTEFWYVIQQHNRGTFGGDPRQYPSLIRQAHVPGQIAPWVQPIDQFDAYLTKNPFTGEGDRVTHNGRLWLCTDGSAGGPDGSLINTWEPGVFGWTDQGAA